MASTVANSLNVVKGKLSHKAAIQLVPFRGCGISSVNFQFQRSRQKKLCHVTLHREQQMGMGRRSIFVQHVAVPMAPSASYPAADDPEYLKKLAENYGFQQIGKSLPEDVTMRDILTSVPKEVFEIDNIKAWGSVLVSVASYALGIFMIAKSPWYLLPLAWAWTGTAITGFFVVGHDCAHKSFSKNKLVEDIVGTIAFMPLIYPYEPWRFKHDQHHAKTNMDFVKLVADAVISLTKSDVTLDDYLLKCSGFTKELKHIRVMLREDTAWQPLHKEDLESSPTLRKALILGYGPLRPFLSIAHWLVVHFNLKKFRQSEVNRVIISLVAVFAFVGVAWPLIIYKTGLVGWIKFWLVPWLGYHFWMSTFTIVHHTAPHIPYKHSNEWNAAQAQLNGTVHCDYPRWIEILCHDINVHIPHHISPRIPSYNLRAAHESLERNWGKYLNKAKWNWRLMKTIMTTCHVYDEDENYVSFEKFSPEESQPISFLKRVMPDYP